MEKHKNAHLEGELLRVRKSAVEIVSFASHMTPTCISFSLIIFKVDHDNIKKDTLVSENPAGHFSKVENVWFSGRAHKVSNALPLFFRCCTWSQKPIIFSRVSYRESHEQLVSLWAIW